MPTKAKTPCLNHGCKELTTEGRCPTHQKAAMRHDQYRRGTAHSRGYGHAWQAYSRRYRYLHPWCVMCLKEGKETVSTQVDHVQAVTGKYDPKFWLEKNLQALCGPCHARKTVLEDGGFGNCKRGSRA